MQSNGDRLEQLKQKLRNFRRLAWKPIVQEGDGDLTASKIAGKPWLNVDEKWPICPNCGKPMQFILQLNLDKLPEKLNGKFGSGILQFFYCTNDCEVYCEGWSPFSTCQVVRIVRSNNSPAVFNIPEIEDLFDAKSIVGWEEIENYPSWTEMNELEVKLDGEEEDLLMDCLYQCADKLAGWADWIQYSEYPDCPICNSPMNQLVFQIDSDENIPYVWGDMGVSYILQCPIHKEEVAFLWQCT